MNRILLSVLLLNIFLLPSSFAHGDLDERILEVTEEIKASQDSAYLYFKRGKLYFQHEEYEKSIADLKEDLNVPVLGKRGKIKADKDRLLNKSGYRVRESEKSAIV